MEKPLKNLFFFVEQVVCQGPADWMDVFIAITKKDVRANSKFNF